MEQQKTELQQKTERLTELMSHGRGGKKVNDEIKDLINGVSMKELWGLDYKDAEVWAKAINKRRSK